MSLRFILHIKYYKAYFFSVNKLKSRQNSKWCLKKTLEYLCFGRLLKK